MKLGLDTISREQASRQSTKAALNAPERQQHIPLPFWTDNCNRLESVYCICCNVLILICSVLEIAGSVKPFFLPNFFAIKETLKHIPLVNFTVSGYFSFKIVFILICSMFVYMSQQVHEDQRTIIKKQFSPSTM